MNKKKNEISLNLTAIKESNALTVTVHVKYSYIFEFGAGSFGGNGVPVTFWQLLEL